jgi:hypothetical protein
MPVRKFRSVEEMTPPTQPRAYDPANLRLAISLSRACLALDPRRWPPGVHKYRSIADAAEARERWERSGR